MGNLKEDNKMSLFAGGSKSITNIVNLPNRRILDEAIYFDEEILVGDCPGADLAIQEYLKRRGYDNVTVYASGGRVKCNVGEWEVRYPSPDQAFGADDRDRLNKIRMALECDHAVMAWDGKSRGTRQNIVDLMAIGVTVSNMTWEGETDSWYYLDGSVDAKFLFGDGCYDRPLKLWLDDLRPAPEEYVRCLSVAEAKLYISAAERSGIPVEVIDCDHDLGVYSRLGGDGIKLLDWLAERGTAYPVKLHTMNPVGRENKQREIERYWNEEKKT